MWFAVFVAVIVAVVFISWGWSNVPKTWSAVDAQWGMSPDHPENASEAFNRGVSTPGMAGPVMAIGVFVVTGVFVILVTYGG